jgi:hypothetical protein
MSVIVFTREEVAALNRHAQTFASRLPEWSAGRASELACAFRALHIAQAAAAAMTYSEGSAIPEPFDWDGADDIDGSPAPDAYWPHAESGTNGGGGLPRLLGGIGHARYNTISNGGTDFLPERYATVLGQLESDLRSAIERDVSTSHPFTIPTRAGRAES